jgi:SAM-dependent methyltransferase
MKEEDSIKLSLLEVTTNISQDDEMYDSNNPEHYFSVGQSAIAIIENSLTIEKKATDSITRILDLPCGHGRVTRFLRARFPDVEIVVCDLNRDGVDFCSREFNTTGVYSSEDFSNLSFDQGFDLIWVGSLITHFNPKQTSVFLNFITKYLNDDGKLIFSSHGAYVAGRLPFARYGLSDTALHETLGNYFKTGYGYADYPNYPNYGISLISKDWLDDFFQTTNYAISQWYQHQWDQHHDVYVVRHSL